MDKFKYEIYDYSKVGIPRTRVLHRKCVSLWEHNAFKNAHYSNWKMAEYMFNSLKTKFERNRPKIYDYSPNFNFDYEIIIGNETYKFHETSGKKE